MDRFAIGVGANLGDRAATIARAQQLLMADGQVRLLAAAPLIVTAPVGGPPGQPSYLNGAWVVETHDAPLQLLERLLTVEQTLGRLRTVPCGPRTIDLDLLLAADGRIIDHPALQLPHPRLHLRAFVLQPLAVVAGDWIHPRLGCSIAELAEQA